MKNIEVLAAYFYFQWYTLRLCCTGIHLRYIGTSAPPFYFLIISKGTTFDNAPLGSGTLASR